MTTGACGSVDHPAAGVRACHHVQEREEAMPGGREGTPGKNTVCHWAWRSERLAMKPLYFFGCSVPWCVWPTQRTSGQHFIGGEMRPEYYPHESDNSKSHDGLADSILRREGPLAKRSHVSLRSAE